jgi:uncharacterized protein involved in exopolysaccharide biosynthesis
MRRELGKLEGGDGNTVPAPANSAGFENLRRFRDMKFLERLTELLTQQFEAAKIDEAKNATLVQVLDKAIEPEKKSWPKRTLIVILSSFVAVFLAVFWAFVREAMAKTKNDPEQLQQLIRLKSYLRVKQGW